MLTVGFVGVELSGLEVGSLRYRLATWLSGVGVLGCVYWSPIAVWVAVPTNIVCGLFLPAAYASLEDLALSARRGWRALAPRKRGGA